MDCDISVGLDPQIIIFSSFIALVINHRHSYKQQETLNLLSTHYTVENLLSCIKLGEKAKCKVLPALHYSEVYTSGLRAMFLVYQRAMWGAEQVDPPSSLVTAGICFC